MNNKKKIHNQIFTLIPVLITGIFVLLINQRMFPITEGWWETYAWLSKSSVIYKDFSLALPPLYVNLTKIILGYTEKILYIRYFFIFVYLINFLLLYYLCRLVTKSNYAIVGVFIAEVLLINKNPVWLSKDYHTLVSILTCLFVIFTYKYIINEKQLKTNFNALYLGLISALIVLTKQNIALICIIATLTTIFLNKKSYGQFFKEIVIYFIGFISLLVIYSYFEGSSWISVYSNNDSKGDIKTVFLRFLVDPTIRKITLTSVLVASIFLFLNRLFQRNASHVSTVETKLIGVMNRINKFLGLNKKFWGYTLFFVFLYFVLITSNINNFYKILIAFFLTNIGKYFLLGVDKNNGIFGISLIFLAYAGTMTAGYNNVSLEILIAIFTTIATTYLISKFDLSKYFILFVVSAISIILFYNAKWNNSAYNWWGYTSDSLNNAIYSSNNPKLEGLNFDYQTYSILNITNEAISKISPDDTLLSYPSIPLFYWLYDKKPFVKSPVQWFDVFPTKDAINLLEDLKKNNPKLVFWLRPGYGVYQGHLEMKKSDLPMIHIDDYLIQKIEQGKYKITDSLMIINGIDNASSNFYKRNINDPFELDFICPNCSVKYMSDLLIKNNILAYTRSMDIDNKNYVRINFKNQYEAAFFIKSNNIIPLNQKHYIFYVLKRVD